MSVLDTTTFDFHALSASGSGLAARITALVRNDDARAVLHVGVKSPVTWLDIYPAEFALAPKTSQIIVAELRPDLAGNSALSPVSASLFGQYLSLRGDDAGQLPADTDVKIAIIPPLSVCPNCGAELPEGVRECRRCGERIRLCPVCAAPNTWIARTCRLSNAHILRTEPDWLISPGGDAAHAVPLPLSLGTHLARRWSFPAFPVSRASDALEWSAPLAAFGMVIASAIETTAGRATVQAFDITNGSPLWDFDLSDPTGVYPDRGSMAISVSHGALYVATLDGSVVAIDIIRGTRRWETKLTGRVYGGVVVHNDLVFVPAGEAICLLSANTGELQGCLTVNGRLDAACAADDTRAYVACDDGHVTAFDLNTQQRLWSTPTDGEYDAAPILHHNTLYVATMSGTMYGLDTATGNILWQTKVSSKGIAASPVLSSDGLLFVAADDGFVHIIAAISGNLVRSRRVSATPLRSSPVCSGHTVFLGSDDGSLYTLDSEYNVQRAYETTAGARIATAGLALYGDTLIFAATNGVMYVLRATA